MLQILLIILRIYLEITLVFIIYETLCLVIDKSWMEDLESGMECMVFLVTIYLLALLWPAMLVSCLIERGTE